MNVDHLVAMANQIGEFFEAMPDRDEAMQGLAGHIRKFWAPRMRHQLTTYWRDGHDDAFRPIVREALTRHSILPTPVPVTTEDARKAAAQHAFDGGTEA